MPKATSKGDVSGSESEPERTRSAKQQPASTSKSTSKDKGRADDGAADEKAGSDDEDGDEEEYEIEAILDAKHGTFPEGRIGYLVKWKGYEDEHNSWVDEKDAEGAQALIQQFWKGAKKGGRKSEPVKPKPILKSRKSPVKDADSEMEEPAPAKKRGRSSKAASARHDSDEEEEEQPQKQKKPRKSTGAAAMTGKRKSNANAMEEDGDTTTYADMRKWKDASTWEHLIESIDTVERTEGNELFVYFTLKNGKGHGKEKSDICKKKMPYRLIEFYESNLRWKQTDDDDAMEE